MLAATLVAATLQQVTLSGAIDIATRDGARDRRRVAGSVGLASSRLSVEGPIGQNVSYLLDARRTYLDWFVGGLRKIGATNGELPYFFQDLHAKVTSDLGGVRRLSVSGYLNSESLRVVDERQTLTLGLSWGNSALSVHYRDRLGSSGLLDVSLGHSRFGSDLIALDGDGSRAVSGRPEDHEPPADTVLFGDGAMGESRADMRITWHAGRTTIMAGTQAVRFIGDHRYDLADEFEKDDGFFYSPLALSESSWRLAAYSTVEVPLRRGFSSRVGLRVDHFRGWRPPLPRLRKSATRDRGGTPASRRRVPTRRWPPCATKRLWARASSPTICLSRSVMRPFRASRRFRWAGRVPGEVFGSASTRTRAHWTTSGCRRSAPDPASAPHSATRPPGWCPAARPGESRRPGAGSPAAVCRCRGATGGRKCPGPSVRGPIRPASTARTNSSSAPPMRAALRPGPPGFRCAPASP